MVLPFTMFVVFFLLSTGLTYTSSIILDEETDDEEEVEVDADEFKIEEGDVVEDDEDEFEEEDDDGDEVELDDVDVCIFDEEDEREDNTELDEVEFVCRSSLALQTNLTRGCTLNTYEEINY